MDLFFVSKWKFSFESIVQNAHVRLSFDIIQWEEWEIFVSFVFPKKIIIGIEIIYNDSNLE